MMERFLHALLMATLCGTAIGLGIITLALLASIIVFIFGGDIPAVDTIAIGTGYVTAFVFGWVFVAALDRS